MAIRDKNVEWLEKRVFIPAKELSGAFLAAGTTPNIAIKGTGTGAAEVIANVNSSGLGALQFATNTDTIAHLWMPYDLDTKKQVRFRVAHGLTSGTSLSATWVLTYQQLVATVPGVTGASVVAAAATALDTAIPVITTQTVAANDIRLSDYGVINKNTLSAATWGLNLLLAATTITANLVLYGIEISYTPRMMGGPEKNLRGARRLDSTAPWGVKLAAVQEG
jgi:hypothetical protein